MSMIGMKDPIAVIAIRRKYLFIIIFFFFISFIPPTPDMTNIHIITRPSKIKEKNIAIEKVATMIANIAIKRSPIKAIEKTNIGNEVPSDCGICYNHIMESHKIHIQDLLASIHRMDRPHTEALARVGLITVKDLLLFIPNRYTDARESLPISHAINGSSLTLYGRMGSVKVVRSFKGHVPMTTANLDDGNGKIKLVFFNQAYIGKMYPDGTNVKVIGTVTEKNGVKQIANPTIEKVSNIIESSESLFNKNNKESKNRIDFNYLMPIYRETKGITSNYIYELIKKTLHLGYHKIMNENLPSNVLKELNLPSISDTILYIHIPKSEALTIAARKRLAFEEIFYMKIIKEQERYRARDSITFQIESGEANNFIKSLSYTPTNAQDKAIKTMLSDMKSNNPMSRMLEGDVGSGKTLVAAALIAETINMTEDAIPLQCVYMAPTEILATQQFESFIQYYKNYDIEIGLLTSKGAYKFPSKTNTNTYTKVSRTQLLKWLVDGKLSVIVGTHSLIGKSVIFKNLALTIIDEQHRFGVRQRKALAHKKGDNRLETPHLLSMTATPIPRTLALTIFGDLDLTILDELPKGRQKIITELCSTSDISRKKIYKKIKEEIDKGHQIYIIAPRIDDSDAEEIKNSVMGEYKKYKDLFPDLAIEMIHGKDKNKNATMESWAANEIDILVSTSVVEVGVNVPNATVMVIEGAERFGLAALHQLRGRVGRGSDQSYCYLFTDSNSEIAEKRLLHFASTTDGFALAEKDLESRGAGSLLSGKQWGMSDIAMEAIRNRKLVEIASKYAKDIIMIDPTLKNNPNLLAIIEQKERVHLE